MGGGEGRARNCLYTVINYLYYYAYPWIILVWHLSSMNSLHIFFQKKFMLTFLDQLIEHLHICKCQCHSVGLYAWVIIFRYGYNDSSQGAGYGHNYQSYHRSNDSLKGKIEQKYWKTKQKVIEKLKKDQDEFVVAGDAEVDARLEAYRHINLTCSQLMVAVEMYQNRIFGMYYLSN